MKKKIYINSNLYIDCFPNGTLMQVTKLSEDYLKLMPKQMKFKKQRVTIQCKDDEENDEVIQRKYKRIENEKIKKKVIMQENK